MIANHKPRRGPPRESGAPWFYKPTCPDYSRSSGSTPTVRYCQMDPGRGLRIALASAQNRYFSSFAYPVTVTRSLGAVLTPGAVKSP
jgi:hypothetical protein